MKTFTEDDGTWLRTLVRQSPSDLMFASIASRLTFTPDKTTRQIVEENQERFVAYQDLLRDELTEARLA